MSVSEAFDAIAASYDDTWSNSHIGRAQRDAVWRAIDPLFQPGMRLLDIGCGTGIDAAHFASRGLQVHAIDASPEMVRLASLRVPANPLLLLETGLLSEVGQAVLPAHAALLNFGVLNCIPDLDAAARSLADSLTANAPLVVCNMGRFCLCETLWYLLHVNPRKAFRRFRKTIATLEGHSFPVSYPTVRQLEQAFAPHFRLESWQGVGVAVPPSYLEKQLGSATHALKPIDSLISKWPGFRALADHRLLIFRRTNESAPRRFDRTYSYARFRDEYLSIRKAEGRGSRDPAHYLALPYEDLSGKLSWQWKMRAQTYRYFERRMLPALERKHPRGLDVLDLGAGVGWLSYRLAVRGHRPVAVDLLSDELDGLGATKHYPAAVRFPAVEAEFDYLPFPDAGFDLAIFNASLHYSPAYQRTLSEALRCLRPGGRVVILDSPVYQRPEHGERMREERHVSFEKTFGFRSDSVPSIEFLDVPTLRALACDLRIEWTVHKPWYGWQWHSRPVKARLKGARPPSRFWILSASRPL